MIALDTKVLVRALVADDDAQVALARELLSANAVLVSRTVLLETEWVLRSRYRASRPELLEFFLALLGTEDAVVENAELVAQALEWYRMGADFADALHLAACGGAVMHTFDQEFCRAAREAGLTPEVRLLEI